LIEDLVVDILHALIIDASSYERRSRDSPKYDNR